MGDENISAPAPVEEKPKTPEQLRREQVEAYYAADAKTRHALCEKHPHLKQTFSAANHPQE